MNFEKGKLYKCPNSGLLIYPSTHPVVSYSSQTSPPGWSASSVYLGTPETVVKYWSEILNCTVRCSEPNEIFMFLEEKIVDNQKYLNILFGDKQGWIFYRKWLEIEKIF